MSLIEEFYTLKTTDHRNRKLFDYWGANDEWLEDTHDYIQWMFPLQEASAFNVHAPLLSEEDRYNCLWNESVYDNFCRSFNVMCGFYGFYITYNNTVKLKRWVTPQNHNFLRLTRILKSSMLMGAEPQARFLFRKLNDLYKTHHEIITSKTVDFWKDAVGY